MSSAADYIPQDRFTAITVLIVLGTLIIGILVPHSTLIFFPFLHITQYGILTIVLTKM